MIKRNPAGFRRNPTMVANPSKKRKASRRKAVRRNPAGKAHKRKALALRGKSHARKASSHRKVHSNPRKVAPGAVKRKSKISRRKSHRNPASGRGLIRHNPVNALKEYALPLAVAVGGTIAIVALADAAVNNASWMKSIAKDEKGAVSTIGNVLPSVLVIGAGAAAFYFGKKKAFVKDAGTLAIVLGGFVLVQKLASSFVSDHTKDLFLAAPAAGAAPVAVVVAPQAQKGMSGGNYYTLKDLQSAATAGAQAAMKGMNGGIYARNDQAPALSGYVMQGVQSQAYPSYLGAQHGAQTYLPQVTGGLGALDNYAD